jgi:HSP20 family protein
MTNQTTQTESAALATATRRTVAPRYTVEETAEAYLITAYVPGASASEVETIVDGEKLVVNARRGWTPPTEWVSVHRETSPTDYRLVLALDRRVNRDGVKAQLTQGVLTLTLPKAEETKPRRIEILG